MNAWRRLIESRMAERGLSPAELARRSGLSRQTVYSILANEDEHIKDLPGRKTIDALAAPAALDLPADHLLLAAGEAYGIPIGTTVAVQDLSSASEVELARELLSRAVTRNSQPATGGPAPLQLADIDSSSVLALVKLRRSLLADAQAQRGKLPGLALTLQYLAEVVESAIDSAANGER